MKRPRRSASNDASAGQAPEAGVSRVRPSGHRRAWQLQNGQNLVAGQPKGLLFDLETVASFESETRFGRHLPREVLLAGVAEQHVRGEGRAMGYLVEARNRKEAIAKAETIYLADGFGPADGFELTDKSFRWRAQALVQGVLK
jgi:hypothetical protein